jgi:hypothetical protein
MNRRQFIKITSAGIAVAVTGAVLSKGCSNGGGTSAVPLQGNGNGNGNGNGEPPRPFDPVAFHLDIMEVEHEMIDGTLVYSWAYAVLAEDPANPEKVMQIPGIPGPILFIQEGRPIHLTVRNTLEDRPVGETHGFVIFDAAGLPIVRSLPLAPGQDDTFVIPGTLPAGTYLYQDSENVPVGRVLGLHGVLVVMPRADYPATGAAPSHGFTPYGAGASVPIMDLFGDLGNQELFPGEPWHPNRQMIWIFNEVDPYYNELAKTKIMDGVDFRTSFLPRYFTLNGRSGFFSSEHTSHETTHVPVDFNRPLSFVLSSQMNTPLIGRFGQPILIRSMNVGLDTCSPHPHGNHSYLLAADGAPRGLHIGVTGFPIGGMDNAGIWWIDAWTLLQGETKDLLFPMMVPPDIPAETLARIRLGAWGPGNLSGTQEMMALVGGTPQQVRFPSHPPGTLNPVHPPSPEGEFTHLQYPMHSHQEISQGAAGGNYPMGTVAHIIFTGFIDHDNHQHHHGH